MLDDIIVLKAGDQILVDCELLSHNEIEVDESLITGEPDSILKIKMISFCLEVLYLRVMLMQR